MLMYDIVATTNMNEEYPPIQYSEKYEDDKYYYRHVILPKKLAQFVPQTHLLTETEWRNLGVQQSPSWEHYMIHFPEMHILMFRMAKTKGPA